MGNWIDRLTGSTRSRLLRLVRAAPRTVPELAETLGISGTAVRGHLAGLQRDGMVEEAGQVRDTGGKPARQYRITREAEELFPKAYSVVLGELVSVLGERLGEEELRRLLGEVGERAGEAAAAESGAGAGAGAAPTALEVRVERAVAILDSLGGEMETERESGSFLLRGAGCPLSGVVGGHPALCELVRALVEEITGGAVEERCDREGRPRCAFRVSPQAPSAIASRKA